MYLKEVHRCINFSWSYLEFCQWDFQQVNSCFIFTCLILSLNAISLNAVYEQNTWKQMWIARSFVSHYLCWGCSLKSKIWWIFFGLHYRFLCHACNKWKTWIAVDIAFWKPQSTWFIQIMFTQELFFSSVKCSCLWLGRHQSLKRNLAKWKELYLI